MAQTQKKMTIETEEDFYKELIKVVQLDYDAIEAYEAAINRIHDQGYKDTLREFKEDHKDHVKELSAFLTKNGYEPPTGPGIKSLLTQGKVVLANLMGDYAIIAAMRSNELETNAAYAHINEYEHIPSEIKARLQKDYKDEKKHLNWTEETLERDKTE